MLHLHGIIALVGFVLHFVMKHCSLLSFTFECIDSYVGQFLANAHGPGTGKIWLDDIACTGNELSIGNCEHSPWGEHNCLHTEDVSIRCGRFFFLHELLLSSLWVSRTGSASDWCALQEALYTCIDTIPYNTLKLTFLICFQTAGYNTACTSSA